MTTKIETTTITTPKRKMASYRQRGYQCQSCDTQTMIFGQDPAPVNCPNCGRPAPLELKWDHLVQETVTVSDYPKS